MLNAWSHCEAQVLRVVTLCTLCLLRVQAHYVKHTGGWFCLSFTLLSRFLSSHWLRLRYYFIYQLFYFGCSNSTIVSQESEGSDKDSKLHSFQASLCTLAATQFTLIYICTLIRLSCSIKQAGIIILTILSLWEAPETEPLSSVLTIVY